MLTHVSVVYTKVVIHWIVCVYVQFSKDILVVTHTLDINKQCHVKQRYEITHGNQQYRS